MTPARPPPPPAVAVAVVFVTFAVRFPFTVDVSIFVWLALSFSCAALQHKKQTNKNSFRQFQPKQLSRLCWALGAWHDRGVKLSGAGAFAARALAEAGHHPREYTAEELAQVRALHFVFFTVGPL